MLPEPINQEKLHEFSMMDRVANLADKINKIITHLSEKEKEEPLSSAVYGGKMYYGNKNGIVASEPSPQEKVYNSQNWNKSMQGILKAVWEHMADLEDAEEEIKKLLNQQIR